MNEPHGPTDVVPKTGEDTPEMTPEMIEERLQLRGLTRTNLTAQQEKLMILIATGSTIVAAARATGYRNIQHVYTMLNSPEKRDYLQFYKDQMNERVVFTRENAHHMLMDAWVSTANATEQVKVVDALTKLHGLNAPDPANQTNVQINIHNAERRLEQMSDDELLALAGQEGDSLEPQRD